ncbi:MAG: hypothetical protein IKT78_00930 [Ruminiclostridium sp.]|nr:hypothetical protein [Ruminiclostridium sp.]
MKLSKKIAVLATLLSVLFCSCSDSRKEAQANISMEYFSPEFYLNAAINYYPDINLGGVSIMPVFVSETLSFGETADIADKISKSFLNGAQLVEEFSRNEKMYVVNDRNEDNRTALYIYENGSFSLQLDLGNMTQGNVISETAHSIAVSREKTDVTQNDINKIKDEISSVVKSDFPFPCGENITVDVDEDMYGSTCIGVSVINKTPVEDYEKLMYASGFYSGLNIVFDGPMIYISYTPENSYKKTGEVSVLPYLQAKECFADNEVSVTLNTYSSPSAYRNDLLSCEYIAEKEVQLQYMKNVSGEILPVYCQERTVKNHEVNEGVTYTAIRPADRNFAPLNTFSDNSLKLGFTPVTYNLEKPIPDIQENSIKSFPIYKDTVLSEQQIAEMAEKVLQTVDIAMNEKFSPTDRRWETGASSGIFPSTLTVKDNGSYTLKVYKKDKNLSVSDTAFSFITNSRELTDNEKKKIVDEAIYYLKQHGDIFPLVNCGVVEAKNSGIYLSLYERLPETDVEKLLDYSGYYKSVKIKICSDSVTICCVSCDYANQLCEVKAVDYNEISEKFAKGDIYCSYLDIGASSLFYRNDFTDYEYENVGGNKKPHLVYQKTVDGIIYPVYAQPREIPQFRNPSTENESIVYVAFYPAIQLTVDDKR